MHPIQYEQALKLLPKFIHELPIYEKRIKEEKLVKLLRKTINFDSIVSKDNYDITQCYPADPDDKTGRRFQLTKVMVIDGSCKLYRGINLSTGEKVVIKHYFKKSKDLDTQREMNFTSGPARLLP